MRADLGIAGSDVVDGEHGAALSHYSREVGSSEKVGSGWEMLSFSKKYEQDMQ
jgi:hypothetical protein